MSKPHDIQDTTGVIGRHPGRGVYHATGIVGPTNAVPGFAPGCLYQNVAGAAGSTFYVNTGTAESATWVNVDGNAALIAAAQASLTAAESDIDDLETAMTAAQADITAAESDIVDNAAAIAALANSVVGVAAGYKLARGVSAVTGTLTVVTGLATVVAVVATAQSDPDGTALAEVSATIGDQAGAPAAGSVILKCWKITAADNGALIAATDAKSVNWIAVGT